MDGRTFIRRNYTTPGWEDDDIRGRQLPQDAGPDSMFSWLLRPLHISQMLFCHRPDPMLTLKINPAVGFVANNLCLVLGYLGKFLYYQTLTGWPWENLLKKLNHTKDNQSSDTRKLGSVPYRWCQYIISLEDKDSIGQTKSDNLKIYWATSNGSS